MTKKEKFCASKKTKRVNPNIFGFIRLSALQKNIFFHQKFLRFRGKKVSRKSNKSKVYNFLRRAQQKRGDKAESR